MCSDRSVLAVKAKMFKTTDLLPWHCPCFEDATEKIQMFKDLSLTEVEF